MLGMGLLQSSWAVLALPAAILIGFAFAAAGMAATTFMRSWQDFEFVTLATLPMFLFSTTFYPLQRVPRGRCRSSWSARRCTRRSRCCAGSPSGVVGPALLVRRGLPGASWALAGLLIAGRRIGRLLLT